MLGLTVCTGEMLVKSTGFQSDRRGKLMCNMVTVTDNSPTLLAALENCRDFKYSSHKINMGKLDLTSLI